jgi:hypothetical protein
MLFSAAGARGPETRKTGTSRVPVSQKLSINSKNEDSSPPGASQPTITLPGDRPTSVPPLLLIAEQLALCSADARDLQRFAEWIYFGRSRWLAQHKKTLPDPEWLDRQRYGAKRLEVANG